MVYQIVEGELGGEERNGLGSVHACVHACMRACSMQYAGSCRFQLVHVQERSPHGLAASAFTLLLQTLSDVIEGCAYSYSPSLHDALTAVHVRRCADGVASYWSAGHPLQTFPNLPVPDFLDPGNLVYMWSLGLEVFSFQFRIIAT